MTVCNQGKVQHHEGTAILDLSELAKLWRAWCFSFPDPQLDIRYESDGLRCSCAAVTFQMKWRCDPESFTWSGISLYLSLTSGLRRRFIANWHLFLAHELSSSKLFPRS